MGHLEEHHVVAGGLGPFGSSPYRLVAGDRIKVTTGFRHLPWQGRDRKSAFTLMLKGEHPIYFSQFGEDQRLHKIFGARRGTCVEVGANDGSHFSNTRFFEQQGWTCVLVEPNPSLWPKIERLRPNSQLFKCAASGARGKLTLHILPGTDEIATVCVERSAYHENYESAEATEVQIDAMPLDDILESSGIKTIDFISIDVEGHEMEVLKGFSLSRWNPRIVLLEDDSDFQDQVMSSYMRQQGYVRCYRTHANDWYAKVTDASLLTLSSKMQILYWRVHLGLRRSAPALVKLKRALLK